MKKQANQTARVYNSAVLEDFFSLSTPEELARTEPWRQYGYCFGRSCSSGFQKAGSNWAVLSTFPIRRWWFIACCNWKCSKSNWNTGAFVKVTVKYFCFNLARLNVRSIQGHVFTRRYFAVDRCRRLTTWISWTVCKLISWVSTRHLKSLNRSSASPNLSFIYKSPVFYPLILSCAALPVLFKHN